MAECCNCYDYGHVNECVECDELYCDRCCSLINCPCCEGNHCICNQCNEYLYDCYKCEKEVCTAHHIKLGKRHLCKNCFFDNLRAFPYPLPDPVPLQIDIDGDHEVGEETYMVCNNCKSEEDIGDLNQCLQCNGVFCGQCCWESECRYCKSLYKDEYLKMCDKCTSRRETYMVCDKCQEKVCPRHHVQLNSVSLCKDCLFDFFKTLHRSKAHLQH